MDHAAWRTLGGATAYRTKGCGFESQGISGPRRDSKFCLGFREPAEDTEPEAETTEVEEAEKAEAVAEAETITKTEKLKRKRSKAKEPVAV